jgi:TRAP-type mannitol/chloroaromatic compound transport system permease small subunit
LWDTYPIVCKIDEFEMKLSAKCLITYIEKFTESTGKAVSWLILGMVLLICYDVAMRYLFQQGSVALQELEWHLFALMFLLGAAYTLKHDDHVRVDIVYQSRFVSDRGRAWINILGTLCFLFPFSLLILFTSWPFVENAFYYHEGSPDPGGLPYRFILKGAILLAFVMLMLQGLADLLKQIQVLKHKEGC